MTAILTLTLNPALDIAAEAERVEPTHKVRCASVRRDPGGGGINVARVIQRLGGAAEAYYTAGGPPGTHLAQLLDAEGLAHHPLPIAGITRESFAVRERSTGLQYRFILPGPTLADAEWRACLDAVLDHSPAPAYLVASGSLPPGVPEDAYAELARRARAQGIRLVLDTSGAALRAALAVGVYLIKPSRHELEVLTGAPLADPAVQEAVCRGIVAEGGSAIVALSLGADGALLTWRGGQLRLTPPAVTIRSTVGAGDSFVAGLTRAIALGWPMAECLRLAVAAGTAALLDPGTELCHRDEVAGLYARMGGEAQL